MSISGSPPPGPVHRASTRVVAPVLGMTGGVTAAGLDVITPMSLREHLLVAGAAVTSFVLGKIGLNRANRAYAMEQRIAARAQLFQQTREAGGLAQNRDVNDLTQRTDLKIDAPGVRAVGAQYVQGRIYDQE